MADRFAEAVALLGCVLTLLSGLGVLRFSDVLERSHALTKASTLGLVFVLLAAAWHLDDRNDVTSLVLAGALQIITMPVGANLLNRAVYLARDIPHRVDTVDELRAILERGDDPALAADDGTAGRAGPPGGAARSGGPRSPGSPGGGPRP